MPNAAARSFGVALAVFGLAALAQFRRAWVHWLFAAAVITFCARFLFRTTRELVDYLRAPNTPATEPGEHAGAVAGQIIVVIVITVFCTRVTLGEPARRYFRRGGA